jgi:hypothetical protein
VKLTLDIDPKLALPNGSKARVCICLEIEIEVKRDHPRNDVAAVVKIIPGKPVEKP